MSYTVRLAYGKNQYKELAIEEQNLLGVLQPKPFALDTEASIEQALENPIGSPPLGKLVRPGEKVVIVTSDVTRPFPTKKVLPKILAELARAGVGQEDITIVFAIGNHRRHTEREMVALVGEEIYRDYRCLDADSQDVVYLGRTSRGTPVEIFRPVVEADRRILLGNVEYHYFAGYSGGFKAIMPGCASRNSIQANHSLMVMPGAEAGELQENPVRQDIEEAAQFLPVDFILNVVLDEKKQIVGAYAGHPVMAHREAVKLLDTIYRVEISQPADIVVASAGGYPKDINLYQAQKALDNAKRAVKSGGILILVAECAEGFGDVAFARWVREARHPQDLIERVKTHFELGGHKAAAIAMARERIRIFLVSGMDPGEVRKAFLEPYSELTEAYHVAFSLIGSDAQVLVIPQAGSLLPTLKR